MGTLKKILSQDLWNFFLPNSQNEILRCYMYAVLMASRKLLLSSISYNSAFITTPKRHNEEQRSYKKDQKMGRGT
jgi:hypothetical protein